MKRRGMGMVTRTMMRTTRRRMIRNGVEVGVRVRVRFRVRVWCQLLSGSDGLDSLLVVHVPES